MLILLVTLALILFPIIVALFFRWSDQEPHPDFAKLLVGMFALGCGFLAGELTGFAARSREYDCVRTHEKCSKILGLVDAIENAEVSMKIRMILHDDVALVNRRVKAAKSSNAGLWDWWTVDELAELDPIE